MKLETSHHSPFVVADPLTRRLFLRAAGALVALPLLPSLAPNAWAQSIDYRKAVFLVTEHGRFYDDWDPSDGNLQSKLTASQSTLPAADVAAGVRAIPLSSTTLGRIFGSSFNPVLGKLAYLQGLDAVMATTHNRSIPLSATLTLIDPADTPRVNVTSIDVKMARSTKLYTAGFPLQNRVLRIGSYTHSHDNAIEELRGLTSAAAVVNQFVTPFATEPTAPPSGPSPELLAARKKRFLIDRVLGEYRTVRNGRQISATDKPLLDNYVERLSTLRDNVNARVGELDQGTGSSGPANACEAPGTADFQNALVAALACGSTRLATWSYSDLDHDHAHSGQPEALAAWRIMAKRSADLMIAMDQVVEANGKTMLDNSVVMLTSELSNSSSGHGGADMPVLMAGSADGRLRTGELISFYRSSGGVSNGRRGGRRYNELLLTVMRAMGLTSADYGTNGIGDYSCPNYCDGDGGRPGLVSYYQNSRANDPRDVVLPYYLRA